MRRFRKKPSPSATPTSSPPPTPTPPIVQYIKKELAAFHPQIKDKRALAASSSAIAMSIISPSSNPTETAPDGPGSPKESGWGTAYAAAKMAVDMAKESSDMFLPVKAVAGALSVLIKNYDQTAANEEQIGEIEGRVQSLHRVLSYPVGDRDNEEKQRREILKGKLTQIITKLGPLSERRRLVKFLKNADHADELSGLVQDLDYAISDYQMSLLQNTYENTKRIESNTEDINGTTDQIDKTTKKTDKATEEINEMTRDINKSTKEINEMAKETNEMAKETNEVAKEIDETTKTIDTMTKGINEVINDIHEATKEISGTTREISEAAKEINEATKEIGETKKGIHEATKKVNEIIEAADLELLGKLDPVRNAGHQAGHHDLCLRGTRESVLDGIMRWAEDPQDRHVFWLNGLAGTGKSTIAQTFCEMLAQEGILGASFFCSRDYLDRKELKNILPTLAYQLACKYPSFRSRIIGTIKRDPSVARNSLTSQLKELIAEPLSSTHISCIIVVDALDECVDDQPTSAILSVLGRYLKHLPSVKFFITGRPEPRIRTGFRLPLLEPFTQIFLLHEVELSSVGEDIRLYLREKLNAVAKRRSDFDLPNPWPRDEDLTVLTKKASGLFIFASTLVRFIESEHHEPNERLQLIVTPPDSTVHEGRAGIDPLYTQVLMHAFSEVNGSRVFENFRRVLGAVILSFNPLTRAQIAKILGISASLIMATLRHLHSVLLVPHEDFKEIRVFHKSFPDFLQDRDRCSDPKFFIDSCLHHGDIALGCLALMKRLKPNPCDLPDFVMNRDMNDLPERLEDKVGSPLRYACGYWAMHVQLSPTTGGYTPQLVDSAIEFFKNNAVPWIEVMSLENRLEDVIHSVYNLLDWLGMVDAPAPRVFDLRNRAEDCLRFTMNIFHLIQLSAPHIYYSASPLSPTMSTLRSMILPENTLIAGYSGCPNALGSIIRAIKASSEHPCMTTFGYKIAAAWGDGAVAVTGSSIQLLSLRDRDITSRQLNLTRLTVDTFDQGRLISALTTPPGFIIFLESHTMSEVLAIPTSNIYGAYSDYSVLCASVKSRIAAYHFRQAGQKFLQLWEFGSGLPIWTAEIQELPSIGGISPVGSCLVTFHTTDRQTNVEVRDTKSGELRARQTVGSVHPIRVTFDSETRFCSYHDTCRIWYNLSPGPGLSPQVFPLEQQPLDEQSRTRQYRVDDSYDWVIRGSERICWIPPGYIRTDQAFYSWEGSALFMLGQDGRLRKLTFRHM